MRNQNLSENFNIWNYKPWWCQPWSIILTGIAIIGSIWLLFNTIWSTVLIAIPITLWWIYFLVLYPQTARKIDNSEFTENSERGKAK